MRRWIETQGYVLVWNLALRRGPAWRWLHDTWADFWYRHYCPYPTIDDSLTARACIKAGACSCNNLDRYSTQSVVAGLRRNLATRDDFIVKKGLWSEFTDQLPRS